METVKKRIEWVDTVKFICIMFVMLSHLESGSAVLERFYTPFFLSAFFFLSGYVYRQPSSFREHMGKKLRGLLWPWLVFCLFNIALSILTPGVDLREVGRRLVWCGLQIRGMGDELWFVAALFMAFIPFYFFIKWDKPLFCCLLAAGLSLGSLAYSRWMPPFAWGSNALPWHLQYVFQAMLWMVLGYYFKQYGETFFDRYNTRWGRGMVWGLYLAAVYVPWKNLGYLSSILGIFAIISLGKSLPGNGYFRFVGANTLTYFALHGRVYAVVELTLAGLAGSFYRGCLSNPVSSSVLAVAITIVVSLILMIPAEIINRWFPWVLGKKRK